MKNPIRVSPKIWDLSSDLFYGIPFRTHPTSSRVIFKLDHTVLPNGCLEFWKVQRRGKMAAGLNKRCLFSFRMTAVLQI